MWSQNLLDPVTDPGPLWHGLLASILLSTKLVKDVKQTLAIYDTFYRTKNSKEAGISLLDVERINMI